MAYQFCQNPQVVREYNIVIEMEKVSLGISFAKWNVRKFNKVVISGFLAESYFRQFLYSSLLLKPDLSSLLHWRDSWTYYKKWAGWKIIGTFNPISWKNFIVATRYRYLLNTDAKPGIINTLALTSDLACL